LRVVRTRFWVFDFDCGAQGRVLDCAAQGDGFGFGFWLPDKERFSVRLLGLEKDQDVSE